MKKISDRRREWLDTREAQKRRRALRYAGLARNYLYKNGDRLSRIFPIALIRVPKDLASETEELRSKIHDCVFAAMAALQDGRRVRLDFTHTQRAYPGGMLMLLAYLELMLEFSPSRITAVSPRGALITQLLQHFGFAERLSMNCGGIPPSHESVLMNRPGF